MKAKVAGSKVDVDKTKCKGCQYCLIYCPKHCFKMSEDVNRHGVHYAEFIGKAECISCGLCAAVCPDICITVYKGLGDEMYKKVGNTISTWLEGNKTPKEEDL